VQKVYVDMSTNTVSFVLKNSYLIYLVSSYLNEVNNYL